MTEYEKIEQIVRLKNQTPLTLEPTKSALLIIDAQRYFARPEYPFGQVFEKLAPGAADGYYKRVKAVVLPNRGFRVLVAEDACTEVSEEMHRAALFTFSYVFGRVKTAEETIRFFDDFCQGRASEAATRGNSNPMPIRI